MFQVPDDWTIGNESPMWIINLVNRVRATIALSITITADTRDPEDFITQEMTGAGGAEPVNKGSAMIGGRGLAPDIDLHLFNLRPV
jgi:hypothetical protein